MSLAAISKKRDAQTLLTLVLMIGSIIIAVAAVFIVLVIAGITSAYGYRSAQAAEGAATAGVEDAMIQLVRNGGFSSGGYAVTPGSYSANVTVSQATPSAGYVTALSVATVSGVTRKLSALFSESASTGQVNLISVQTLP